MATEVFINIKDLPELTEPSNGDYIVVENSTGTHIIDFKNFIIPSANTVITTTVEQNSTAILNLSSGTTSQVTYLSSSIDKNTSDISTLSSSIGSFQNTYVGKTQITIPIGSQQASNILSPISTVSLTVNDLMITPANSYAAGFTAYPISISNNNVTIKANFTTTQVVSSPTSITLVTTETAASQAAVYNVFAFSKV